MPGIRKPSNVLELTGAWKKNPQRKRERQHEPKDTREIGDPPKSLSVGEKRCWRELVENAIPGVLVRADRATVECAARLMHRIRSAPESWKAADQANYTRLLAQMGMTPADRSKIILLKDDSRNPFDED